MNARTRSPCGPLSQEEDDRELVYAAGVLHPYIAICRQLGQREVAERLERVRAAMLRAADVSWYGEAAAPISDPTADDLRQGRQLLSDLLAGEAWPVPDDGTRALLGRAWAALLLMKK